MVIAVHPAAATRAIAASSWHGRAPHSSLPILDIAQIHIELAGTPAAIALHGTPLDASNTRRSSVSIVILSRLTWRPA
jgi:predicted nuclease with RNAse H fold